MLHYCSDRVVYARGFSPAEIVRVVWRMIAEKVKDRVKNSRIHSEATSTNNNSAASIESAAQFMDTEVRSLMDRHPSSNVFTPNRTTEHDNHIAHSHVQVSVHILLTLLALRAHARGPLR